MIPPKTTLQVLPTRRPDGVEACNVGRASAGAMAVALMLGLAACGGGSSGSDGQLAADPAPTPAAPTPAAPTPASPTPAAPTPGAPVAKNSCSAFPDPAPGPVAGTLAANVSSPAGSSLTYSLVTAPTGGTLTFSSASSGNFTYTRSADAPGRGDLDSFVYKVTDSAGQTSQATAQLIYGRRRIMPLGDSISEGIETYVGTQTPPEGPAVGLRVGYRKVLRERLEREGYAVDFVGSLSSGAASGLVDVQHEGHGGIDQANVANSIDGWLTGSPADVVLLHIGTNDIYQFKVGNRGAPNAQETAPVLSNASAWAAGAGRPPVRLLLARIISQRTSSEGMRDLLTDGFNTQLTGVYTQWIAANTQPKFAVSLVDMNSKLNSTTDLTAPASDDTGLHPNATGYAKMGNAWFDYLVENKSIHKCP